MNSSQQPTSTPSSAHCKPKMLPMMRNAQQTVDSALMPPPAPRVAPPSSSAFAEAQKQQSFAAASVAKSGGIIPNFVHQMIRQQQPPVTVMPLTAEFTASQSQGLQVINKTLAATTDVPASSLTNTQPQQSQQTQSASNERSAVVPVAVAAASSSSTASGEDEFEEDPTIDWDNVWHIPPITSKHSNKLADGSKLVSIVEVIPLRLEKRGDRQVPMKHNVLEIVPLVNPALGNIGQFMLQVKIQCSAVDKLSDEPCVVVADRYINIPLLGIQNDDEYEAAVTNRQLVGTQEFRLESSTGPFLDNAASKWLRDAIFDKRRWRFNVCRIPPGALPDQVRTCFTAIHPEKIVSVDQYNHGSKEFTLHLTFRTNEEMGPKLFERFVTDKTTKIMKEKSDNLAEFVNIPVEIDVKRFVEEAKFALELNLDAFEPDAAKLPREESLSLGWRVQHSSAVSKCGLDILGVRDPVIQRILLTKIFAMRQLNKAKKADSKKRKHEQISAAAVATGVSKPQIVIPKDVRGPIIITSAAATRQQEAAAVIAPPVPAVAPVPASNPTPAATIEYQDQGLNDLSFIGEITGDTQMLLGGSNGGGSTPGADDVPLSKRRKFEDHVAKTQLRLANPELLKVKCHLDSKWYNSHDQLNREVREFVHNSLLFLFKTHQKVQSKGLNYWSFCNHVRMQYPFIEDDVIALIINRLILSGNVRILPGTAQIVQTEFNSMVNLQYRNGQTEPLVTELMKQHMRDQKKQLATLSVASGGAIGEEYANIGGDDEDQDLPDFDGGNNKKKQ